MQCQGREQRWCRVLALLRSSGTIDLVLPPAVPAGYWTLSRLIEVTPLRPLSSSVVGPLPTRLPMKKPEIIARLRWCEGVRCIIPRRATCGEVFDRLGSEAAA